jgi:hypothetical protein
MIRLPQCTEADDVLSEVARELGVRWVSVIDYLPVPGCPSLGCPWSLAFGDQGMQNNN